MHFRKYLEIWRKRGFLMTKKYSFLCFFLMVWLLPAAAVRGAGPAPHFPTAEVSVVCGKSKALTVEDAGDSEIIWKSSNEKIATVTSSGKVTGIRGGNAVITARVKGLELQCRVKVRSLKVKETFLFIKKGSSYKIRTEEKNISEIIVWRSSDKKIAKVSSNGKVTAKKAGTVTITATANGCSAVCKVQVITMSLSDSQAFIREGQTKTLSVKGTSKKVNWSTSLPSVASVSKNGKVTAKKEGTAVITAKIGKILLNCKVTVTRSIWKHLQNQYLKDGSVDQLLFVKYTGGSKANVQLYNKVNKKWKKILSCKGYVGKDGIGQAKKGISVTPTGTYTLTQGFGIKKNPGAKLSYLKVDKKHYWCSDDRYYNQLIDIRKKPHDCAGEHLIDNVPSYNYGMFLDYNKKCLPGKGSAIFLHCTGGYTYTGGGIAVGEKNMIEILRKTGKGAKICIYPK